VALENAIDDVEQISAKFQEILAAVKIGQDRLESLHEDAGELDNWEASQEEVDDRHESLREEASRLEDETRDLGSEVTDAAESLEELANDGEGRVAEAEDELTEAGDSLREAIDDECDAVDGEFDSLESRGAAAIDGLVGLNDARLVHMFDGLQQSLATAREQTETTSNMAEIALERFEHALKTYISDQLIEAIKSFETAAETTLDTEFLEFVRKQEELLKQSFEQFEGKIEANAEDYTERCAREILDACRELLEAEAGQPQEAAFEALASVVQSYDGEMETSEDAAGECLQVSRKAQAYVPQIEEAQELAAEIRDATD